MGFGIGETLNHIINGDNSCLGTDVTHGFSKRRHQAVSSFRSLVLLSEFRVNQFSRVSKYIHFTKCKS
jgi:hypothetical protein